jgi:omega-amidase
MLRLKPLVAISTPMTALHITLLQADLAWQAADHNRALLAEQLRQLRSATDLVILPEMFTSAFAVGSGAIAEEHPGATLLWLQQQAKQLDAALTGSVAVTVEGQRYNRLYFVKPSGEYVYYDKRHLFRMLDEHKRYAAGHQKLLVEWRGWRILPLICYDLRFPVWSRYTQAEPYDLLLYVANWPAARTNHWRRLLQARAIENLCYVAGVNRVGRDGNQLDYDGHSAVIDPHGDELLQAAAQAGAYQCSIELAQLQHWRERFPAWLDADTFTIDCEN